MANEARRARDAQWSPKNGSPVVIRVCETEVCHMSDVAREVSKEVSKEIEAGLA
jgi:hypothetical protein